MDKQNEMPPVPPGTNPDTKVINKDYFQKQGAEQPINTLPNISALVERFNLDPEAFEKQLKDSSEKIARYVGEREKGIDGKPLSGEAAEAQDEALKAEVESMAREIFAKLSAGHNVGKDQATDVLMLNLSLDSNTVDPGELKKIYQEAWTRAMQTDWGELRGFDAWTKINRRGEEYKPTGNISKDSDQTITEDLDKTREALKQERVTALASQFHENWRKTRLNAEGNFEPRVKPTTDEVWIAAHSSYQVDIANTSYQDLPKDWQAENKAAADVVIGILDEANGNLDINNPEVRSQVGQKVHEAWLSRNSWAKDGELDKRFDELPEAEQAKDIEQVEIGLSLGNNSSNETNLNQMPEPAASPKDLDNKDFKDNPMPQPSNPEDVNNPPDPNKPSESGVPEAPKQEQRVDVKTNAIAGDGRYYQDRGTV